MGQTRRRRLGAILAVPSALLALLVAAPCCAAFNVAPGATKEPCEAGKSCVSTQPSTPSWLTIADGNRMLVQQTLTGVAADEYGIEEGAEPDTTLYRSVTPYRPVTTPEQSAPFSRHGKIVQALTANLAGSEDPGDTDAAMLFEDRTLEVVGPQRRGYSEVAETEVPGSEELLGVVALAEAGAEPKPEVIVITAGTFYTYKVEFGSSGGPELTLPTSTISLSGQSSGGEYEGKLHTKDFESRGVLGFTGESEWTFDPPSAPLAVYQAPPAKGEYNGAATTFALAYDKGSSAESYVVAVFGYREGGLHLVDAFSEKFPDEKSGPLQLAYAISGHYIRAATLAASGAVEEMTSFDTVDAGVEAPADPLFPVGDRTETSTLECPAGEGRWILAVDAIDNGLLESQNRSTGASLCALEGVGDEISYVLQRSDQEREWFFPTHEEEEVNAKRAEPPRREVSSGSTGSFSGPSKQEVAETQVQLDFPCEEFLYQFAENPTPDGFPSTYGDAYCDGTEPFGPGGAAAVVAAQFQYVAGDSSGKDDTLREHSISYGAGTSTSPASVKTSYDTKLVNLPDGIAPVAMLPLDPRGITWNAHLLVYPEGSEEEGKVIKTEDSTNPTPVALMAAPPYYAGGSQQVNPTTTTFTSGECDGSGEEQSNSAGIFGGVDASFLDDAFEVEALAKVSSSWTTETGIETCENFAQEFIAGNNGFTLVAENSLLFRVETGIDTYLDLTENSLGVGITDQCDPDSLAKCDAVFTPNGSQYALQTLAQLHDPRPNNAYAADDRLLLERYGAGLEAIAPTPGNPASYPSPITEDEESELQAHCAPQPSGAGSGISGVDVNPFVAPTPEYHRNLLRAKQETVVNPASGGNEAGTSSTLAYGENKEESSSTSFSIGAEASMKIGAAKFGAEYSHGWGTSVSQSFEEGTEFSGGVYDFQGFFSPYNYRLYECEADLAAQVGTEATSTPIFLVNYTTRQRADGLALNMVEPSLPEGTVGRAYDGDVFASGGKPTYEYKVASGELPPGLTLDHATGHVHGTPTESGTYAFRVGAVDDAGNHASQAETITIRAPLSIETPLPDGEVGVEYEHALGAKGAGESSYRYLLTYANESSAFEKIPPGLEIDNATGVLRGTPAAAGTYTFGVYVIAEQGEEVTGTLETETSITIGDKLALSPAPTPGETVRELPPALAGQKYSVELLGSGGNAEGYEFRFVPAGGSPADEPCSKSAAGPAGFTLDSKTGVLEGTPSAAGSDEFAVELCDGAGGQTLVEYALTVAESRAAEEAPLITSVPEAPANSLGTGKEVELEVTATGEPTPVLALSGRLPAGLEFSDDGEGTGTISGTVAAGAAGVYPLEVSAANGIEPSDTRSFELVVSAGPTITLQPTDQTAQAPEGSATFSAAAEGEPAPDAQWEVSEDGGATWTGLNGETSSSLTVSGLEPAEDGNLYRAHFENEGGEATTEVVKLTVEYAPRIDGQPSDLTVKAGEPAEFSVGAEGEPAPATRWQVSSDGGVTWTPIAGAESTTLTLAGIPAADDGNEYRAVVSNGRGSVISEVATLTVQTAPAVTTQPADLTVDAGEDASFEAAASGRPAPSVQWEASTDGGTTWADVSGATSPALELATVSASEDGDLYRAKFRNDVKSATTDAAKLTVQTAPAVTAQPADLTVDAGQAASFEAAASGKPAPNVRWQVSRDGGTSWSELSGATAATLTLAEVSASDDGNLYRAVFENAVGDATSEAATLTVRTAPTLTTQPTDLTVDAGEDASFEGAASGRPAPSVQWEASTDGGTTWADVSGATSPALELATVSASDDGDLYRAKFTNVVGGITTTAAKLTVRTAPAVTAQPAGQAVPVGAAASFRAAASGKPVPAVRWQLSTDAGRTWTDVSGATAPTLVVPTTTAADDGQLYRAVFTNPAGTAVSGPARLTVESAPQVTVPPSSQIVAPRHGATFTVAAAGSPAPSVQWQVSHDGGKRWSKLGGAVEPTLRLKRVGRRQSGLRFRAVLANSRGRVISRPATLIVSRLAAPWALCGGAPSRLPYPARKLGRVVRYVVYVDGHRVSVVRGQRLRVARVPKLDGGFHVVKIVATTARGSRLTTRRTYIDCVAGGGRGSWHLGNGRRGRHDAHRRGRRQST